jgi:hypothetical protein
LALIGHGRQFETRARGTRGNGVEKFICKALAMRETTTGNFALWIDKRKTLFAAARHTLYFSSLQHIILPARCTPFSIIQISH